MMPQEEKKHKRRVHYSGKYPKKFEEKYKEHQPEKYQDMIEHVIRKGASFDYGTGNSGFSADSAGADRV